MSVMSPVIAFIFIFYLQKNLVQILVFVNYRQTIEFFLCILLSITQRTEYNTDKNEIFLDMFDK